MNVFSNLNVFSKTFKFDEKAFYYSLRPLLIWAMWFRHCYGTVDCGGKAFTSGHWNMLYNVSLPDIMSCFYCHGVDQAIRMPLLP